MFENFTFGAQAHTKYEGDIPASPTDTSFSSPVEAPPPYFSPFDSWESGPQQQGLNEIVHKFSNHSLTFESEEPQRSIWHETRLSSPDCDMDPFTEEELTYVSTTRGMTKVQHKAHSSAPDAPLTPSSNNGSVGCRRLQRQLNVQLQSCSNHMRDINTLVEDMITSNSQCNLHKSPSRQYLSSPPPSIHGEEEDLVVELLDYEPRHISVDEDEGFGDYEEPTFMKEDLSLRRASTPTGIRKYGGLRCRSSSESVGTNGMASNGRMKVRCLPRMRKRDKVVRVPA
ncbi:hypothetical protein LSUB1_G008722 [Lachnellula subtilissima]|uniref:Uncharacterized protein n=1 Tax=Lachnellula subtilissima TaxID=602034 RepID=A0A8H8U4D8_9HELO|nr:hypothetical protein LSUB1_G008722 [Lachnellula subtilissima]